MIGVGQAGREGGRDSSSCDRILPSGPLGPLAAHVSVHTFLPFPACLPHPSRLELEFLRSASLQDNTIAIQPPLPEAKLKAIKDMVGGRGGRRPGGQAGR